MYTFISRPQIFCQWLINNNTSYAFAAYDSFGSLRQLKMLNLGNNDFNDSILPYLNTLTSLTTLNLGYNSIEGSGTMQGIPIRFRPADIHVRQLN